MKHVKVVLALLLALSLGLGMTSALAEDCLYTHLDVYKRQDICFQSFLW